MRSLQINDLSAKVEQSGSDSSSTLNPGQPLQGKHFIKSAEVEQGNMNPNKKRRMIKRRKHHFTTEELLTSYRRHLRRNYQHFLSIERMFNETKFFIQYLVGMSVTVYGITESVIKKWQHHLLIAQHQSGRYYTASSIAFRIHRIKKFLDWLETRRLIDDHPLKTFSVNKYKAQITPLCRRRPTGLVFNQNVPQVFVSLYQGASEFESTLQLAKTTFKRHQTGWIMFFNYLDGRGIREIKSVDETVLDEYSMFLHRTKNTKGQRLSLNVITRHLTTLKGLFYYLARFKLIDRDPTVIMRYPKNPRGLPTAGINSREMKKLLQSASSDDPLVVRDRAILETLFSSGIRRNELCQLHIKDVDLTDGMLRVNCPKGGLDKQRVVPIGRIACQWILRYLKEVRPRWCTDNQNTVLFLNTAGSQLEGRQVFNVIKSYVLKARLKNERITTHSFRVACATEMLKGKGHNLQGAGIKWVQEQLGHASIATTERYLRLVPMELKKVHNRYHPRERMRSVE